MNCKRKRKNFYRKIHNKQFIFCLTLSTAQRSEQRSRLLV
nr:MAG TPA: hypothetical protein [Caudoviricetes sp.]